jgi:hypothetical protein
MPADVDAAFAAFPATERGRLMRARELVFAVAETTAGVGRLTETLRWGEPSYLTLDTGSGSTIRLGRDKASGAAAVHFICHTNLVDAFRQLYPDALAYQGSRSILLEADDDADGAALRHCLALALTYHARKKRGRLAA